MMVDSINAILTFDFDFVFEHKLQQSKASLCCQNHSVNLDSEHLQPCLSQKFLHCYNLPSSDLNDQSSLSSGASKIIRRISSRLKYLAAFFKSPEKQI